jgi:hypothetical protein
MLTLRLARADDLDGLRAIVVMAYAAYLPRAWTALRRR